MAIVITNEFTWGFVPETELKPLPPGWSYIRSHNDFLKCSSPDGRKWFVMRDGVALCRTATAHEARMSKLREGEEYIDEHTRHTFTGWVSEKLNAEG